MSAVNVTQVAVLDNPTRFNNPLQFEIQYECMLNLQEDLEWKLTYVGSAEDVQFDQVLDTVYVGPVVAGSYRFVFQADPPDVSKIPATDVVGVTALLLTCHYRDKEFIRVGYYVNTEYDSEELRDTPPTTLMTDRLMRNILADKPRVTKFPIEFDATSIPTLCSGPGAGDASMDGSLAGDMIEGVGFQSCAGMVNTAPANVPLAAGMDIMMEG
jgi:histone chaperone ASF1